MSSSPGVRRVTAKRANEIKEASGYGCVGARFITPMSLDEERKVPLRAITSSRRIGAIICLAGVALTMLGYFLPMFTQSNPQVPGSAHGVYEWQAVNIFSSNLFLTILLGLVAAIPLVGILIVGGTSVAAFSLLHSPEHFIHSSAIVSLRRVAAGWGVGIQLLFDVFVFQIFMIGYARTDIALGFVVVLIGFGVSVIGAWVIPSQQKQERARHS